MVPSWDDHLAEGKGEREVALFSVKSVFARVENSCFEHISKY